MYKQSLLNEKPPEDDFFVFFARRYVLSLQLSWQGELECITEAERALMIFTLFMQNFLMAYIFGEARPNNC